MSRTKPVPGRMLLHPLGFLALGLGSGLLPRAPGTAGTVAAIPLYLLLQHLYLTSYLVLVLLLFLAGIPICSHMTRRLGVHDHPAIVWDEVVGYLLTMASAPHGWVWVVTGFALFRLFDIAKPWPIGWCDQRVSGGFGIMLDDLLAGLYSLAVLQLAAWYLV